MTPAQIWPDAPAALVLTTRRDGDAVVVIEADPATPKLKRSFYALRELSI